MLHKRLVQKGWVDADDNSLKLTLVIKDGFVEISQDFDTPTCYRAESVSDVGFAIKCYLYDLIGDDE